MCSVVIFIHAEVVPHGSEKHRHTHLEKTVVTVFYVPGAVLTVLPVLTLLNPHDDATVREGTLLFLHVSDTETKAQRA